MQGRALKLSVIAVALLPLLAIQACSDDSETPTAPSATAASGSAQNEGTPTVVRGGINRMTRSGSTGIDVLFRVGDEQWVRGDAATVVLDGSSSTFNTTALRDGLSVTIEGRQRADYVYAGRVTIDTNR